MSSWKDSGVYSSAGVDMMDGDDSERRVNRAWDSKFGQIVHRVWEQPKLSSHVLKVKACVPVSFKRNDVSGGVVGTSETYSNGLGERARYKGILKGCLLAVQQLPLK